MYIDILVPMHYNVITIKQIKSNSKRLLLLKGGIYYDKNYEGT